MSEIHYCPSCEMQMSNPHACKLCGWTSEQERERPRTQCDRPMCKRKAQVQFLDSDDRPRALCWEHYEQRRAKEPREAALDQLAKDHPEWHRRPDESQQAYRERMREIHAPMFQAIRERMINDVAEDVRQERIAQGPADERWFRANAARVYGFS